ncbi:MAG: carbohydrate kinase family protein [Selenomonadaceae bacterium]|nr:carbohydrate kinase family protein [Selenomonadaceae bacterium]
MSKDISIIGAGVIDVLAGAVDEKIFSRSSTATDFITSAFGGDALNEAVALSRLGKNVQWLSKVGDDDVGRRILNYAEAHGIDISRVKVQAGLDTAINLVLVDSRGERHFLTNPNSSLRKLSAEDILPHVDETAPIVSFASMFVSPLLDIPATEKIFSRIKSGGRILTADTTRPKNGESLDDLATLFRYVDYFLPNESELAALTGSTDVDENISALLACGLKCAVVKRGGKGCVIATKTERHEISACPVEKVIDTTGAGDCFAAGFLFALSEKMSLVECGKFACAVASCSVEAVGAVTGVTSLAKVLARYEKMR